MPRATYDRGRVASYIVHPATLALVVGASAVLLFGLGEPNLWLIAALAALVAGWSSAWSP